MPLKGLRYAEGDAAAQVSADFLFFVEHHLPILDYWRACAWYDQNLPSLSDAELRILGANDRFWLLVWLLHRADANHPWIYDRCREVEADPDDHLDLWARYHYKSTIITFAGTIQDIIIDPEVTVGIFSMTKAISRPFLTQIKEELETNEELKSLYPDVFWQNPAKEAPSWSTEGGITVKRQGNPKEATVEHHGLIDALPTGRHFKMLKYDDMINEHSVTNPEQIKKGTERYELSDNLGVGEATRKQYAGTRYSFADSYGILIERAVVKPRLHPATHNGKLKGIPVFFSQEHWENVKRTQRSTVAAQMLQDPRAGDENTFLLEHLRPFEVMPQLLNVYILGDPSKGKSRKSDRTAIAVIGIDVLSNRYLLDGMCHRMKLSQRWEAVRDLHKKWSTARGVQMVRVGYEQYGLQTDLEYFEERMLQEKIEGMSIDEVGWVREGGQSKVDRVERLEPYFRNSQIWMPPKVWNRAVVEAAMAAHPERDFSAAKGGVCTWTIEEGGAKVVYKPYLGPSRAESEVRRVGEAHRIMDPIRRLDEDKNPYDLFRIFVEEYAFFPFSPRDDLIDAVSRVEDMDAVAPTAIERGALEDTASYAD